MSASQMSDSLTDGDGKAIGQAIGMMTPLSLGIRGSADEMVTVIGRNSRFPCEQSVIIATFACSSSELVVQVLQGERVQAEDNILIGELVLNGQQVDEETVLKVTLRIDGNGHLFVTVRDLRSNVWQKLKILNACAVPEDQVIRMIEEAEKDPQQEISSGSTSDSMKSAVFLPAPTLQSLSIQCEQEEDRQQIEEDPLIESLCSEYKQAMDEVVRKKKVLGDQELQDLHQAELAKCLSQFRGKNIEKGESELMDKINRLFEDMRTTNSEARLKSEAAIKSVTQQHLKLFEEQMGKTLAQMTVIDEEQINNRFLSIKADMLRKFDVAIKSLDLNPGVTRNVKKNFDHDLESKKVSLIRERRGYLEAVKQKAQQILEQYKSRIWKEFKDEPYMSPEQKDAVHQKVISDFDFCLLAESSLIELQSKLSHELESAYSHLQKLNEEREPRLQQLVEKMELRYATNMAAIICSPMRRPPTLQKFKIEHEKVVTTIFDLFMKDPDIIAVGRFRPEFEAELIQRMDERFKGAESDFLLAIRHHVRQLFERVTTSYTQSIEQEVKKQKPKSKRDLRAIHQKIMDQELSRYESDAVISESGDRDEIVLTMRQLMKDAFSAKKSKLMEGGMKPESRTPEQLRDAAVQSFVLEMGRYIDRHAIHSDRLDKRDELLSKYLMELKDRGVSWGVVDTARLMMNKEFSKMKDRQSKGRTFRDV